MMQQTKQRFKTGHYAGNKWGGKFLRAPDIFFTILEKGKGKLVRLGDIAEVRFGIKTGVNDFFYLPSKYFDLKEEKEYYKLIPKQEGLPNDIKIEKEFLKPVIKSPRECKTIMINPKDLKYKVFMCHKSKKELKGTGALKYIEWGEEQIIEVKRGAGRGRKIRGFQSLETIKGRKIWYDLGEWKNSLNVLPMFENERKYCFLNKFNCYVDAALYYVYIKKDENILNYLLNSTLFGLYKELLSRNPEGLGVLQIKVYQYEDMPVVNIFKKNFKLNKYDNFINREIKPIFEELGFNPSKPIREQEPKPLPDRAELDKIIFDELGLTEEERKEVYWSVAELVKQRLEKAKSLRK